jgi:hypothetical protein
LRTYGFSAFTTRSGGNDSIRSERKKAKLLAAKRNKLKGAGAEDDRDRRNKSPANGQSLQLKAGGLLQLLRDCLGDQLQFKQDVVFNVEAGGVHRSQRVAPEQLGILRRGIDPLLQLAFDLA